MDWKKWLPGTILATAIGLAAFGAPNVLMHQRISGGTTPVLDGIVGAEEWADAAKLPPFAYVENAVRPFEKLNEVMLKFDRDNLYVGFRTYMEIDMDMAPCEADSVGMENVESLELVLAIPGQEKWMRFMVERGGRKTDQRYFNWTYDDPGNWNPVWEYKTRVTPMEFQVCSVWEGEIAIPWKTLSLKYPEKEIEISGNFIRNLGNVAISNSQEARNISWGPAIDAWDLKGDWTFGTITLKPNSPVFRPESRSNYLHGLSVLKGAIVGPGAEKGGKLISAVWDRRDGQRILDYTEAVLPAATVNWNKQIEVKQSETVNGMWTVIDANGDVMLKQAFCNVITPPFHAEMAWVPDTDTVRFVGRSLHGFAPDVQLKYSVEASDGTVYAEQIEKADPTHNWFEHELSTATVPENTDFIAVVRMMEDRKESGLAQSKFNRHFPEWIHGADSIQVTAPPLGWEPVQVESDSASTTVSMMRNSYRFGSGLLPESVRINGRNFAAAQWELIGETATGRQNFTASQPVHVISQDGRGVTLAYTGESDELKLSAEIRVEFDGLAYYRCRFLPKHESVTVNKLALRFPIVPNGLRYMQSNFSRSFGGVQHAALIGEAKMDRELPPLEIPFPGNFSSTGWHFSEAFSHFYWIGSEDQVCFFVLPSQQDLSIDRIYNRVTDTPENFEFEIELVNSPVTWAGETDYEFGVVLAPSRRVLKPAEIRRGGQFILNDWGENYLRSSTVGNSLYEGDSAIADRFYRLPEPFDIPNGYFYADMIGQWNMKDVQDGNPIPDEKTRAEIRGQAQGIERSHHGNPTLWYDTQVTPTLPQLQPYFPEWKIGPSTEVAADVRCALVCSASFWPNAYLYGLKQRFQEGVKNVYLDMSGWRPCTNRLHGCGYYDKDGNVQPTIPFLATREHYLRIQQALKANDPDGIMVLHGGGSLLNIWADISLEGESWTLAPSYRTLTPEFYQIMQFSSRQLGVMPYQFTAMIYRHVTKALRNGIRQEECIGLAFLHNAACWQLHGIETAGNYLTTKTLLDFDVDADDSVWIPYWRNPWSQYPDRPIAVSSWKRGNRELAVLFNTGYEADSISFPERRVRDAMDGAILPEKIILDKRGFRLVILEQPEP